MTAMVPVGRVHTCRCLVKTKATTMGEIASFYGTRSILAFAVAVLLPLMVDSEIIGRMEDSMLSTLPYLDSVRKNSNTSVTRVGSVDVFSVEENGVEKEIGLCHIPILGIFTLPPGFVAPVRVPYNRFETNQELLTVLLAMQHLNTGDGSIIPEVEGLNERCNIRFTMEAFDTFWSPNVAVNYALGLMDRQPDGQPPGELPNPCLLLGAQSSSSSIALSIVSSTWEIPVFSPLSSSNALDSKEQHPLFGRLRPPSSAQVFAILRFFKEVLGVKHIGVVHMNNDLGISVSGVQV